MKKNNTLHVFSWGAILLQVFLFGYLCFAEHRTLSLKCASSFTSNIKGLQEVNYMGEMTLILTKSGEGNISVEGRTDENPSRIFHHAYFFDYRLDDDGILRAKIKSSSAGTRNEIPEDVFRKQLFDLEFRLRGGMHINKFRNVYIMSTPGLIINTCAPV